MEGIGEIKELLSYPKNIVITTHRNPDGDALGSSLALSEYLKADGHVVKVVSPSEFPGFFYFLNGIEDIIVYDMEMEKAGDLINKADIFFCLDFNSLDRIDKLANHINNDHSKIVLIDHHIDPEPFADYILSDQTASSTCELVYDFINLLDDREKITKSIASSLYTGIITDTGSFKFSTSAKLFRTVADLKELGVDDYKLQDQIFNCLSEKKLRLLAHCLHNRMEIMEEYQTGLIYLTKEDYKHFNIQRGDTEGIVNYLLMLKNVKVAAFITAQPTIVKISLRSKGDISVQEIARNHFNGGGHKNASGGSAYASLDAVVNRFKKVIPNYIQKISV
jgi:phosphoesterase RecJ-like protein